MEYYNVVELATVLGITDAALRQKIRIGEMPSTLRNGKMAVSTTDFENYLEANRCWDFRIPEWSLYRGCKRPIKPQFVKVQGALEILREYGIEIEQRTLKRWVQSGQIKAYNLGGTYYIPTEILRKDLS
ncbi:DNA-binding protein [Effusibacillus lacus]|uniref:DNA-binding protein n=1 Tax=Effusibacillus lacus TaxID=1348429 RepID=A0A292YQR0_9BACL|nr:DNA-binding protein [Effusibacillus lacus]TCS76919.1 hypothetical protein EDD64_101143 [Effusibacillus lacus]GAX91249.1 DNA-binding protein [Effusibacillus lacus]